LVPSFQQTDRGFSTGTESGLTRVVTIVALMCLLVVGAAATSILSRDSVPVARPEVASAAIQNPVSNKEGKKDRLAVATLALASFGPPQTDAAVSEPLRQAFASSTPAEVDAPKIVTAPATPPMAPQKPKLAATRRSPASRSASSFLRTRNPIGRRWKARCGP
jgi:hypothetical protein